MTVTLDGDGHGSWAVLLLGVACVAVNEKALPRIRPARRSPSLSPSPLSRGSEDRRQVSAGSGNRTPPRAVHEARARWTTVEHARALLFGAG